MWLFYIYYDFPKKVDIELPAFEYVYGEEVGEQTTVNIKGEVKRPVFRKSVFEGSIFIDSYEITKEHPDIAWIDMDEYFGSMSVINFESRNYETIFHGFIRTEENLESMILHVNDDTGKDGKSKIIALPANNIEEAMEVYERIYHIKLGGL
ncbi:MAG: hypothetical protein LPK00_14190 [Bacillaceae bacterium]|nr:hypothetical protein [Bacillaceae bacterium]